jgi:hypothetical protein
MARTAAQEHFGDAFYAGEIVDTYRLGLPHGTGGTRFVVIDATSAQDVILPDARLLATGGEPQFVVYNVGTEDLTVYDDGAFSIATIGAGEIHEFVLVSNASAAGVWIDVSGSAESGSPIATGRIQYRWEFRQSAITTHLRVYANAHGYDGVTPVALHVTLGPHTFGALRTDTWAFDTGNWPAGSTLFLVMEDGCIVSGRGGAGGRGSDLGVGLLAQPGSAGGTAMALRIPTVIVSYGTIQGGGGGGGGGARTTSAAGGGGGGGAGYRLSDLGLKGSGGGATNGGQGYPSVPGSGGTGGHAGGSGGYPGDPGSDGSGGGGTGGAAGPAIDRTSGGTYSFIRTGTIYGDQVATL